MANTVTLSKLDKDLWKVFSEFIRLRDADENGYVRCITCGFSYHWRGVDAGHYWPQGSCKFLKFCEENVAGQCKRCNKWGQGEQVKFREALVKKYGEEKVQWLDDSRNFKGGFTREGYVIRIREYKEKVRKLKREKNVME